ncbi:hypothetical protein EYZ11_013186 [Aspergillus tanneri]|uniref:ubiquitinyl hydrolase 1 n=1 Tax=Aspergillus tanneri TaxID=1220188 RepID=A0A4S3J0H5_9EURO|nr:hypothetical protein EYZ11_013186 [Aspergillus tanneri]
MTSPRDFTVLENSPVVMNDLAYRLGLSRELTFYDVYSLDDPEPLAFVPCRVFALLAIVFLTDARDNTRKEEDVQIEWY